MEKLNYTLKLNIKSIVLYERLTQNPFASFTPTIENVLPLLYCMLAANNEFTSSYEETVEYLFSDENFLSDLTIKLESLLKFQGQFSNATFYKEEIEEEYKEDKNKSNEDKPIFISQLIPILVSDCGLDINYVLEDMHYSEIDIYIHYRDEKNKSSMEDKRFWTYLSMLPHIDSKKCKMENLIEFPWEKDKKKKEGLKTIERDKEKFLEFMKSGALKIDNNNNTDNT
jgi:hypothetical protein